jgi:hypothetical protein
MIQDRRDYKAKQSTAAERDLVRYMQEAFGSLATLLLMGYFESEVKQSRSLTILTNNFGVKTRHWMTLRAGDSSGLPFQREPIVLLALLKLMLIGEHGVTGRAILSPGESVRRVLGWEESAETELAISSAIRKYFNVCYVRTDDITYTFPERTERLVGMYRLLRYCEFGHDLGVDSETDHLEGVAVEFSENIVQEFFERRLFRINWLAVTSLAPDKLVDY